MLTKRNCSIRTRKFDTVEELVTEKEIKGGKYTDNVRVCCYELPSLNW